MVQHRYNRPCNIKQGSTEKQERGGKQSALHPASTPPCRLEKLNNQCYREKWEEREGAYTDSKSSSSSHAHPLSRRDRHESDQLRNRGRGADQAEGVNRAWEVMNVPDQRGRSASSAAVCSTKLQLVACVGQVRGTVSCLCGALLAVSPCPKLPSIVFATDRLRRRSAGRRRAASGDRQAGHATRNGNGQLSDAARRIHPR
jgi:hypothetical protein